MRVLNRSTPCPLIRPKPVSYAPSLGSAVNTVKFEKHFWRAGGRISTDQARGVERFNTLRVYCPQAGSEEARQLLADERCALEIYAQQI